MLNQFLPQVPQGNNYPWLMVSLSLILHFTEALLELFNISPSPTQTSPLLLTKHVNLCIFLPLLIGVLSREFYAISREHLHMVFFYSHQTFFLYKDILMSTRHHVLMTIKAPVAITYFSNPIWPHGLPLNIVLSPEVVQNQSTGLLHLSQLRWFSHYSRSSSFGVV